MASAFERVVKSVVQELDQRGELVPVGSLRNSSSFQPYCLLSRRPPSFWRSRYRGTNLFLRDILEPGDAEPGTHDGRVTPYPCLLPVWASGSAPLEGCSFSKVPVPRVGVGTGAGGRAGRGLSSFLFQPSSASVPSNSKTPWTGSCRAAWS